MASALGVPAGKVRIISRYVGGGFGGKTEADQGVEAARLAKIAGKPVQVVYSRQEEFFYDRFRPAAVMKIRAGVPVNGMSSAMARRSCCGTARCSGRGSGKPIRSTTSRTSG